LQKHIDDFPVLIDSSPQIMPLAINLHEDFINEECISIALVLLLRTTNILHSEFIAP